MGVVLQSTQTPATSGDKKSGIKGYKDFSLIAVTLLPSAAAPLDVRPIMVELSYFEDIFGDSISGELFLSDAQGLLEKLEFHGNEYIRFAFGKDNSPDIRIDKTFRIYKVSRRQVNASVNGEAYVMHFCSDELFVSEQYKVSKSYKGKKISEIVDNILRKYIKASTEKYKQTNIQDTLGVYDLIVPNFKPFEAINWLAMYAKSATDGADMVFYENKEGFHFKSLHTLFEQDPYWSYQYRIKNTSLTSNEKDKAHQVFNVQGYEILDSFDTLKGITSGMFANRTMTVDPLLRRWNTTDFDYNKFHSRYDTRQQYPFVNNAENRFGDALYETPLACFKLAYTNKNQEIATYVKDHTGSVVKDMFVENFLSKRKAQLCINNYNRVKLYIAGDPNITVGMTVDFDLLTIDPADKQHKKKKDELYSGTYLVTAVRHIIQTAAYNTVIEIVKESLPKKLQDIDNSNPVYRKTSEGVTR